MHNDVASNATHRSLTRALRLLRSFSVDQPELRVTDLSRIAGEEKSTVSRLLQVLVDAQFVRRNPVTNSFSLSLTFVHLAEVAKASFDLARAADPIIRDLREISRGTVALQIGRAHV